MQPNRNHPQQSQHYPNPLYPHATSHSALAAQAVTAALSNPYGQTYGAAHSYPQASHYAQAYAQYYNAAGPSNVTAEGYTISSAYTPGTQYGAPQPSRPSAPKPQHHGGGQGGWYQPGNHRCSQPGCSFSGSKKSVETHMMDRHLIYPPGWEHRKKKDDWDADPSLKGKPVFIQGTSIKLDTPEAIEQWLAERRKRFPTKQNVEDKERKMREAVERGQIPFDEMTHRKKRRRMDDGPGDRGGPSRGGRGGQRGRGRGRGRGRAVDSGWKGRRPTEQTAENASTSVAAPPSSSTGATTTDKRAERDEDASSGDDGVSDSDSDGAPEVVSSKGPPAALEAADEDAMDAEEDGPVDKPAAPEPVHVADRTPQLVKKPRPKQPRRPLYNPFAQRPSLLRNLLLPEIRMTVSNLSQAIHFLVDNDFLDNVEFKPGQADERKIEVIGETPAPVEAAAAPTAPATAVADTAPAVPQSADS
ncbi:nuclear fragile X mental retardation-interacting protein 1-domain-containing protein [Cubamyces lactineus]|nr:nuclear fragile X mental retardation-interacting protein 1-domain-containing protein [Cubamyces lactineus]